ncbi:MAG: hypothetical protein E7005_03845 [Alphaproteobacteria bacterium]|nr:hypothetical protein [Alphaproteobacteria bacterium]
MEQPNIFDYATSELSQDAFLCYLLAFGKEQYKKDFPKEYTIAHKFLAKCGIEKTEEILSIERQVEHIDVLIVTASHILIIEDKTYTNEHDDQIIRYVKNIRSNDKKFSGDKKIKVCYFKTGDYVKGYVPSAEQKVLSKKDCCSLKRDDMLELLENDYSCNLIFENFYKRLNSVKERIKACDDKDIYTWNTEKWFDYLYNALQGHNFNIGWVHNARGGFYGCWFDWHNVTGGEDYKQIEISFADGNTSQVKMCYKFSGKNKETTLNSNSLIKELQKKTIAKGFNASNRKGKTTTYAYKVASNINDIQNFINNAS